MNDDPGDKLYITGLPIEIDDATLEAVFVHFGKVHSCKVLPKREGATGRVALVRFNTIEEATTVRNTMDGQAIQVAEGITWGPLNVKFAVKGGTGVSADGRRASDGKDASWAPGGGPPQPPSASSKSSAERSAEMFKRQEDQKRRVAMEEAKRTEHAAAIAVRKVIQRLRISKLDSIEVLREELDKAITENLDKLGSMSEKVSQEAEKVLQEAQAKIDEVEIKKQAEELKKLQELEAKRMEVDRLETLARTTIIEVITIEEAVEKATECTKCFQKETEEDLQGEALVKAVEDAEAAIKEAEPPIGPALDCLAAKTAEVRGNVEAWSTCSADMEGLRARLLTARTLLDKAKAPMNGIRERTARVIATVKRMKAQNEQFQKLDANNDGKLCRQEIIAFAKEKHGFEPDAQFLSKLERILTHKREGVPFAKFRQLKGWIAIEAVTQQARKKRFEEEEKIRIRKEEETRIKEECTPVLDAAEKAMAKMRDAVKALERQQAGKKIHEIQKAAEQALDAARLAEASLTSAGEALKLAENSAGDQLPELVEFAKLVAADGVKKLASWKDVLKKSAETARAARDGAMRRLCGETEQLRISAVQAIDAYGDAEGKDNEQIFKHIAKKGKINVEQLTAFLESLPDFGLGERADELFKHVAENASELDQEKFETMMKLTYKVSKSTVLTEGLELKSKAVRRTDEGEFVELLGEKKKDEGVLRVKCKALSDDVEGWMTSQGNKGASFLEPIGNFFVCVADTTMTESKSIADGKCIKKIRKDELLKVVEHAQKDEGSGIMRLRATSLMSGGKTGWVSIASNAGTQILKPC